MNMKNHITLFLIDLGLNSVPTGGSSCEPLHLTELGAGTFTAFGAGTLTENGIKTSLFPHQTC